MSEIINKETIKRGLATFGVALMVLSVFAGAFTGSAAAHDLTTHEWDSDADWNDNNLGENNTISDGAVTLDDNEWMSSPFGISSVTEIESVSVVVDEPGAGLSIELMDASSGATVESWTVDSAGEHTFEVTSDVSFSSDKHLSLVPNDTSDPATVSYLSVDNSATNTDPVAEAGDNQTVTAGDTVQFDGSNSSDADGDSLAYEWSFDDGSNATGATANQTFDSAGTYVAELTVEDSHGATSTDSVTVTVEEQTHEVSFDVVDDGVAVENASVVVEDGSAVEVANLSTDANGSAVTSLSDGTYSYTATGADGATIDSGEVVVAGADVTVSTADESESDTSGGGGSAVDLDDDDKTTLIISVVGGLFVVLILGLFAAVRGD